MKKYKQKTKRHVCPAANTDLANCYKTAPTHVVRYVCRRFAARCTWDLNLLLTESTRLFFLSGVPCLRKRLGFRQE
jgi:hypothetical protein